jgi:hypothetical protein
MLTDVELRKEKPADLSRRPPCELNPFGQSSLQECVMRSFKIYAARS